MNAEALASEKKVKEKHSNDLCFDQEKKYSTASTLTLTLFSHVTFTCVLAAAAAAAAAVGCLSTDGSHVRVPVIYLCVSVWEKNKIAIRFSFKFK